MLHVGNVVEPDNQKPDEYYYQRMSFPEMELHYYSKWDITNADSQMHSLMDKGIQIQYDHFSDRKSGKMLMKAGFKLRKVISEYEPDLIHVFWGTTTALMTVLFSSKPVIISRVDKEILKGFVAERSPQGLILALLRYVALIRNANPALPAFKDPGALGQLPQLLALFPNARVINMIRRG